MLKIDTQIRKQIKTVAKTRVNGRVSDRLARRRSATRSVKQGANISGQCRRCASHGRLRALRVVRSAPVTIPGGFLHPRPSAPSPGEPPGAVYQHAAAP